MSTVILGSLIGYLLGAIVTSILIGRTLRRLDEQDEKAWEEWRRMNREGE